MNASSDRHSRRLAVMLINAQACSPTRPRAVVLPGWVPSATGHVQPAAVLVQVRLVAAAAFSRHAAHDPPHDIVARHAALGAWAPEFEGRIGFPPPEKE